MKRLTFKNMLKRMSKNLNLPRKKKENFKSPVKIPLPDDKKAYNTNTEEGKMKKPKTLHKLNRPSMYQKTIKLRNFFQKQGTMCAMKPNNLIHHNCRNS